MNGLFFRLILTVSSNKECGETNKVYVDRKGLRYSHFMWKACEFKTDSGRMNQMAFFPPALLVVMNIEKGLLVYNILLNRKIQTINSRGSGVLKFSEELMISSHHINIWRGLKIFEFSRNNLTTPFTEKNSFEFEVPAFKVKKTSEKSVLVLQDCIVSHVIFDELLSNYNSTTVLIVKNDKDCPLILSKTRENCAYTTSEGENDKNIILFNYIKKDVVLWIPFDGSFLCSLCTLNIEGIEYVCSGGSARKFCINDSECGELISRYDEGGESYSIGKQVWSCEVVRNVFVLIGRGSGKLDFLILDQKSQGLKAEKVFERQMFDSTAGFVNDIILLDETHSSITFAACSTNSCVKICKISFTVSGEDIDEEERTLYCLDNCHKIVEIRMKSRIYRLGKLLLLL